MGPRGTLVIFRITGPSRGKTPCPRSARVRYYGSESTVAYVPVLAARPAAGRSSRRREPDSRNVTGA